MIHLTDAQINENFTLISVDGLSNEYLKALVHEEAVTLKMYDVDNSADNLRKPKGRGGNTTIGIGHLIHYGAIGSTQYDLSALTKENIYKNGISISEVFGLFSGDLNNRMPVLNNLISSNKISTPDQSVKDVFMDYIYNTGRKSVATKAAVNAFKKFGILSLYIGIKTNKVKSISEPRKQMRLNLLERPKAIENFNKGIDGPTNIGSSPLTLNITNSNSKYLIQTRNKIGSIILFNF